MDINEGFKEALDGGAGICSTSDHLKTNLIKFTFVNGLVAILGGFSYTLFQLHPKRPNFTY